MAVIAVLVYIAGLMILSVWMVVAAAFAGTLMCVFHCMIIETRSFVLVRRYGLLGAARWFLSRAVNRRLKIRFTELGKFVILFIMAPTLGYIAPASFPYLLFLSLFAPDARPNPLYDALTHAVGVTGPLGALIATWIWVRGLSYVANPSIKRGRVPPFQAPRELDKRTRSILADCFFWYQHVYTAKLFASIYPFLIFITVIDTIDPPLYSTLSSSQGSTSSLSPPLLNALTALAVTAPAIVPASAAANSVLRRISGLQAAVELCNLLQPLDASNSEPKQSSFPGIITDATETRRKELISAGELLHQTAGRLDAQQPRGFTPHPTATIFRGVVQKIRQHLSSTGAYGTPPAQLIETLRLTLSVLIDTCSADDYKVLATRVSAFDDAGKPSVELFTKPPGRPARIYGWLTATIARVGALVAALTGLAVPIAAITLTAMGKIDINALLGFLKK